jgi:hypothetical protein
MAIYRYSSESIEALSHKVRRHHIAAFLMFTLVVCAAGVALLEVRTALLYDSIFCLVMAVLIIRGGTKARRRVADWFRSTEIEIDHEKVSSRSSLRKKILYRSEIVEACFSKSGIWLRGKARWGRLRVPNEIEDFDKLSTLMDDWLPQHVVRRNTPPSILWTYLQVYGTWAGAALLLYAALASQIRVIAVPSCFLAAAGVAWYFGWCGRRVAERKWKVLLPVSGYLFAAALLGRAFTLWVIR